jgi:hypothetical protein
MQLTMPNRLAALIVSTASRFLNSDSAGTQSNASINSTPSDKAQAAKLRAEQTAAREQEGAAVDEAAPKSPKARLPAQSLLLTKPIQKKMMGPPWSVDGSSNSASKLSRAIHGASPQQGCRGGPGTVVPWPESPTMLQQGQSSASHDNLADAVHSHRHRPWSVSGMAAAHETLELPVMAKESSTHAAEDVQTSCRDDLTVQPPPLMPEPTALSMVMPTSENVLHNMQRSARQAFAGVYKTLSTRDRLSDAAAESTIHAEMAVHDGQMAARLTRVSSGPASSTLSVESDLDSDDGSDHGIREFWSLDPVSADCVISEQVRVHGELSGDVVYLASSRFDSAPAGSNTGLQSRADDVERSTRERLRKSLRLRPSVVPAWDVQVHKSVFNEVCQVMNKMCMSEGCSNLIELLCAVLALCVLAPSAISG